jgi:hypothetical protein
MGVREVVMKPFVIRHLAETILKVMDKDWRYEALYIVFFLL